MFYFWKYRFAKLSFDDHGTAMFRQFHSNKTMHVPHDKEYRSKYGIFFSLHGLWHGMLCDTSVREEKKTSSWSSKWERKVAIGCHLCQLFWV